MRTSEVFVGQERGHGRVVGASLFNAPAVVDHVLALAVRIVPVLDRALFPRQRQTLAYIITTVFQLPRYVRSNLLSTE